MGLLDAFTSTKRPAKNTPVLSEDELRGRLVAVNRDAAPFRVVDGRDENVDFIAEWKLNDPKWAPVFSGAGVQETLRIYLKVISGKHEIRASDRRYTVSWKPSTEAKVEKEIGQDPEATVEVTLFEISHTRGQEFSLKIGGEPAYTETLESGQQRSYRFTAQELKGPIQEVVTACGWTYKGVAFGKL